MWDIIMNIILKRKIVLEMEMLRKDLTGGTLLNSGIVVQDVVGIFAKCPYSANLNLITAIRAQVAVKLFRIRFV